MQPQWRAQPASALPSFRSQSDADYFLSLPECPVLNNGRSAPTLPVVMEAQESAAGFAVPSLQAKVVAASVKRCTPTRLRARLPRKKTAPTRRDGE